MVAVSQTKSKVWQVAKLQYISRLICPKNLKFTICSMCETVFVTQSVCESQGMEVSQKTTFSSDTLLLLCKAFFLLLFNYSLGFFRKLEKSLCPYLCLFWTINLLPSDIWHEEENLLYCFPKLNHARVHSPWALSWLGSLSCDKCQIFSYWLILWLARNIAQYSPAQVSRSLKLCNGIIFIKRY